MCTGSYVRLGGNRFTSNPPTTQQAKKANSILADEIKHATVIPATNDDAILGIDSTATEAAVQTSGGSYLATAEKNALYEAKTTLNIHAVGERVSFRWQKPEWVLKVTVGNDAAERLLTFEKGSAFRDGQISRIQLHLKSPAARDAAGLPVAYACTLTRDDSKRARPWQFGKVGG